jgi:hypothetical protein
MKITIKENKTSEIDFSVAGQWLITPYKSGKRTLVQTTGKHDSDVFEGVVIITEQNHIKPLEKYDSFGKDSFKVFKGTLTFGEIVEEAPQLPLQLTRGALYEELGAKIAEANEGWVPDFYDKSQRKIYPAFDFISRKFSLDNVYYGYYNSSSVPPSLLFKDEEICRKFVKENMDLYEKLYKP